MELRDRKDEATTIAVEFEMSDEMVRHTLWKVILSRYGRFGVVGIYILSAFFLTAFFLLPFENSGAALFTLFASLFFALMIPLRYLYWLNRGLADVQKLKSRRVNVEFRPRRISTRYELGDGEVDYSTLNRVLKTSKALIVMFRGYASLGIPRQAFDGTAFDDTLSLLRHAGVEVKDA